MELRSSRSRSKTPFTQIESFDKELIEKGNHVEKTVVRTTRRTTTFRTNEGATSSTDEIAYVKPMRRTARSETKNVKRLYKTSDYSSEDGENEVTSTKTISQNDKNQIIEDARAAANGNSEVSALDLYKKSGRYWDIYPKTDWTYSQHSKDRVELAPGVVAMPNMSRKTIHAVHESDSGSYVNKQTNTEAYMKSNAYSTSDAAYYGYKPRVLFNNNYSDECRYLERSSWYSYWSRIRRSVSKVFSLTVFYYALSILHYTFTVQTKWFAKLHQLTSRVMLFDTWLLWKTRSNSNKSSKLVLLCLLPLLLFGGWWMLSNLGGFLYGTYFNSTSIATPVVTHGEIYADVNRNTEEKLDRGYTEKIVKVTEKVYIEPPRANEIAAGLTNEQLRVISDSLRQSINIDKEFNTDEIIQKILISPTFKNIVNNFNKVEFTNDRNEDVLLQQQKLIDDLKDELSKLKLGVTESEQNWKDQVHNILNQFKTETIHQHISNINKRDTSGNDNMEILNNQKTIIENLQDEINKIKIGMKETEQNWKDRLSSILSQLKAESMQNNARLTYQINRCCRKPIINIESYVNRIVTSLLNDPEFLKNQNGFNDYLHAMFVAKKDLETTVLNLTRNLDSKYDSLVEDNTRILMDAVTSRLKTEMDEKMQSYKADILLKQKTDVSFKGLPNERVKQIVKEALDIYDADKTGLVDYAMETMGGQILTTRCTENYHYGKAVVSVLGIPLWYPTNTPRTVITPSMHPGDCWAFQNFPGFVVVKLSNKVKIEAFSMEHISKLLVPEGKIDSAPKHFEVYGLSGEDDRDPVKLGEYEYQYDGESIQYFAVENEGHVFEVIELRITSNHGNPNYTCLYRFRVHGKLSHDPS
ncbi:unnamed protein product [Acanthoscelides obtectus]|uniref:SUN domain-containing protein n=1 Tax=Acanthoscelides obtectus TaxID=200917 RepID=A0A9P0LSY2_ACAOB|nr:unnamed protein product [Acanthoscelides obtectus]CAK1669516.1 SUN domain-containing protein 1 [Acanthoscelides obtectus]